MIESRKIGTLALPALVLANVALACGPWLVRLANADGGVGPVAAGFWRLMLALPVLIVAARRMEGAALPKRRAGVLVAAGGIAFAADLALWHVGILHTRMANATLLGNITALVFPLYGFWMARAWPQSRQWLALTLASTGAVLLLGRSYSLSATNLIGDAACIGAGLCYTTYLVAIDRTRGAVPPITTLALAGLVGAPLLLAAAWALGEPIVPRGWTALVLLAIGSQLFGQGLILYGIARTTPLVVGLTLLTQPVVAAAIGWIVYGERLAGTDAIGAIGIAAAVLLVRGGGRRAPLPRAAAPLSSVA